MRRLFQQTFIGEERLRDEPKECLRGRLPWRALAIKKKPRDHGFINAPGMKKCCSCSFQYLYINFGKNAPCYLLHLNFKNKSDFFNNNFLFKLSAITRLCSSQVALRELDRERK